MIAHDRAGYCDGIQGAIVPLLAKSDSLLTRAGVRRAGRRHRKSPESINRKDRRMSWFARPEAVAIVEAVGGAILLVTLTIVAWQIMLQRRDLEFRIYQQINDRYSDILWRAAEDPDLDNVWVPLTARESDWIVKQYSRLSQSEEDILPDAPRWPTWTALSSPDRSLQGPPPFDLVIERKLYRFTRGVLELCEQAHFARTRQSIQPETWSKFSSVLRLWGTSRYFEPVFVECEDRLTEEFAEAVREVVPIAHSA